MLQSLSRFIQSGQSIYLGFGALLISALFLGAHPVQAATCTFASVGTSDFHTAANWDCGFVPGATSTAAIPASTSTVMSSSANVGDVTIATGATLTTTGFDLVVQRDFTSSGGDLVAGSANTITIGRNVLFAGGSFVPGNSTLLFSTSTSITHTLQSTGALTLNNITVSSTIGLDFQSGGAAVFTVLGNVSTTASGISFGTAGITVNIAGDFRNGGLSYIDNATDIVTVAGTTTNIGGATLQPMNGTLILNGDLVNNGTLSFTAGQTGSLSINKSWTETGTFSAGSSTVIFGSTTTAQTIPSEIFNNLTVSSTGITAIGTLAGNATTTGNFRIQGSAYFSYGGYTLEARGDFTRLGGLGSPVGDLILSGTQNQTISSGYAATTTVNKSAGIVTVNGLNVTTALLLQNGTVSAPGTINFDESTISAPFVITGGTFLPSTGTVSYEKVVGATVASTTYYNLSLISPVQATFSLDASTTVLHTLTLNATSGLTVGTNVLTVIGSIVNNDVICLLYTSPSPRD